MIKLLKKEVLFIVVLFVLAGTFRLFSLDLIEFKYDEAYTVFELIRFYNQPYLMQIGPPQSTGIYNPPLFNYLMIAISLFSQYPQYLSFIIALINSTFVVIFYLVVKRFYGKPVGVLASLFLAVSPWGIIFSRKIWIPDLLLPFVILFIYFFSQLVIDKKQKASLPLFIILAILPQMHASGLFFTVITLALLIFFKIKLNLKKALFGLGIGLLPALPYFFRQFTSTPFCIDCQTFLSYQNTRRFFDLQNFLRPFQLLGGNNFEVLLGSDYSLFLQTLPFSGFLGLLFYLQLLLPFLGGIFLILRRRQYWFLLFFPFFLPLLYYVSKTPSYMHYFVVIFPFMVLLSVLPFSIAWESFRKPIFRFLITASFLTLIISNIIFNFSFYTFLSSKKVIEGDYGPVFAVTESYIQEQTKQYMFLPFYDELKAYSFIFAQTKFLHQKLGEYFIQKNLPQLALEEFQKALLVNDKDKFSRANMIYILIRQGKFIDADKELLILDQFDATLSAQLRLMLEQNKQK